MPEPSELSSARFDRVFEALSEVERSSGLLHPGEGLMARSGTEARVVGREAGEIPFDRTADPPSADAPVERRRSSASLVRVSKFSNDRVLRARAFYPDADPPITLKLIVATGRHQQPVLRDASARSEPERWGHVRVPTLLGWGRRRRYAFLAESLVRGRHASTRGERQSLAETMVEAILSARADPIPVSLHVHRRTRARLASVIGEAWSAPASPPDQVLEIASVIRTSPMPAAWCHGDLVPSNLIIGEEGVTVIDFEHAGRMPIVCDLAKVIAKAPDWRPLLAEVTSTDPLRAGSIDTRTQLAMAYLREMSWAAHRERRAHLAGRLDNHRSWLRRCVELVDELVV